ncbi:MAG: hypothetical protein ACREMS_07475 [Gemmatimonadaceae bacterium]
MKTRRGWWRPRNLLLGWCAYWLALIVVGLAPAIAAGWRISQHPQGTASVNASFGNGTLLATITAAGKTTWTGSISVLTLALLVAVPPLLLWLLWLAGASRMNNAGETAAIGGTKKRQLHATDSRPEFIESSTSKRATREES